MDGHIIVGVGNIYANEALFDAGISPKTAASQLGQAHCARLAEAAKETLLRDFVGSAGNPGYFQQQYGVYGRAGQPCLRCDATVLQLRQGQRSTFYCPGCQK